MTVGDDGGGGGRLEVDGGRWTVEVEVENASLEKRM